MNISYSRKAQNEIVNKPKLLRKKRILKAKEFVAAFREKSDDYHLMAKFAITPRNLRRIYSVLLKKELLSEAEYCNRKGKAPELEEQEDPDISTSTTVSLAVDRSEGIDRTDQGLDPSTCEARSQAPGPKTSPQKVADLCPNCGKPKKTSLPQECIYCGVIFRKLEILNRKRTTLGGSPTRYHMSS